MAQTPISVFISHVSEEAELAVALKQLISDSFSGSVGAFVSSDGTSILAGEPWLDHVRQALLISNIQVVLCSPMAVRQPWVNFEAGAAWLRDIPVIPLCHSGMKPKDLPIPLQLLQALEIGRAEGVQRLLARIARSRGIATPQIDFEKAANHFAIIEARLIAADLSHAVVHQPSVLCACSTEYASKGFQGDVFAVHAGFPNAEVIDDLSSTRLLDLLATRSFDIIHLSIRVHGRTGAILFDDPASAQDAEELPAEAFARLVEKSGTKLVVLATCKAVLLAVQVAHLTNMVACDIDITDEQAAHWSRFFYMLLGKGQALYNAFELATRASGLPMFLVRHADVAFGLSVANASPR